IVLNWAERTEAHAYDNNLSSIRVRSQDGFSFSLDVAQVIHIGAKNAPRVISRVGSMQNLVDHVLQPTVGNYFRNSAQEGPELERSEQRERNAETNAQPTAEDAKGEAAATRLRADAEADATRALGAARADAYRQGQAAIGPAAYSAMQIATIVGERGIKIVP